MVHFPRLGSIKLLTQRFSSNSLSIFAAVPNWPSCQTAAISARRTGMSGPRSCRVICLFLVVRGLEHLTQGLDLPKGQVRGHDGELESLKQEDHRVHRGVTCQ